MTTIDKEYVKEVLNQYADVAIDITNVRQEIIKERNLDEDEKLSWAQVDIIKTFLSFGCNRLLDEFIPREQQ